MGPECTPKSETQLTSESFTKQVDEILERLQKKKIIVSDVLNGNGNQYVDLVQEGGGVLGIALLGYTYIFEKCNIRFRRLAGTSAGAINTLMLSVIGEKADIKSEKSIKLLLDQPLFDLVDGHPTAKWLIKNFIKSKGFFGRIKNFFLLMIIAF